MHTKRTQPRGAALLLVMIVVIVLGLMGVAALMLSRQESVNVNQRITHSMLIACAEAAEKKLWAEYALYSGQVPPVRPTVIPGTDIYLDGGMRLSIAHYDSEDAVTNVTFDDQAFKMLDRNALSGSLGEMDQTNSFRGELGGRPYQIIAHCTDAMNRQYEVELMVRFGI